MYRLKNHLKKYLIEVKKPLVKYTHVILVLTKKKLYFKIFKLELRKKVILRRFFHNLSTTLYYIIPYIFHILYSYILFRIFF